MTSGKSTPMQEIHALIDERHSYDQRIEGARELLISRNSGTYHFVEFGRLLNRANKRYVEPIVTGEDEQSNVPDFAQALDRLARMPEDPLETWMLAGVIATGVVAIKEVQTQQPVTTEVHDALIRTLTDFGLRPIH